MRTALVIIALTLGHWATAQQQWRFHVAFEDGTGAKDTIWLVYDTAATIGSEIAPEVDSTLGEAGIYINPSVFQTWLINWDEDSTKTWALPYSFYPNFAVLIDAFNWQLPVTMSWDTSLFHVPYFPVGQGEIVMARMDSQYFFFVNNHSSWQAFDMQLDNHVIVNDMLVFASFGITFSPFDPTSIQPLQHSKGHLRIRPNPASDLTWIHCNPGITNLEVRDVFGILVSTWAGDDEAVQVDVSQLSPGTYVVEAITRSNSKFHGKLVRQE